MHLYRLSTPGWILAPALAFLYICSQLNRFHRGLPKGFVILSILPVLPLLPFGLSGRFLATAMTRRGNLWIETVEPQLWLLLYFIAVIIGYMIVAFIWVRKDIRRKQDKKRRALLEWILYPLVFAGSFIIIYSGILSPILPGRLPTITHFIIALAYLHGAILLFFNRVDIFKTDRILKSIFRDEAVAIYFLNRHGKILRVMHQSNDFLDWNEKDLIGSPIHEFMDFPITEENFRLKWLESDTQKKETSMVDKLGKSLSVSLTISRQYSRYDEFQGYLFIARDNRQLKSLKADLERLSGSNTQLRDLSTKDPLTGIFNRAKFLRAMEREELQVQRYGSQSSLIMFDIDHFKKINDTYGHDVGDVILKTVVDTVIHGLRETDVFARWGGEEFIILSHKTKLPQAIQLAERLRQRLEDLKPDPVPSVTASFGVSQFLSDENSEAVLKRVDERLYDAKHQGRNQVAADNENQGSNAESN